MTPITFIQTCDATFYFDMMAQTSRTVRLYCLQNAIRYESYVGIKRGQLPWQAAYNRVYMLKELVDRGVNGWVFYLDADALIEDMNFDVAEYLSNKHEYAGIFAGDNVVPYHINSGGFAINLSHTLGRQLALDYWKAVESIPREEFERAAIWGKSIPEDQLILHRILKTYVEDLGIGFNFLFERGNESFVNHGPFIRQFIRSRAPDFRSRVNDITARVNEIIGNQKLEWPLDGSGYYFPAAHPRLRTHVGVKDALAIRTTGQAGTIVFGPYIQLRAGGYIIRVIGELRVPRNDAKTAVTLAVTSDAGGTHIAEHKARDIKPLKGVILEHKLTIPRNIEEAETLVWVDADQDLDIHAIQIHWTDQWYNEEL